MILKKLLVKTKLIYKKGNFTFHLIKTVFRAFIRKT